MGIPVAYLGILGYGLIYICLKTGKKDYGLILASAGAVTSMLLVLIQAFVLKQFCVFCLISAAIMITIWLLLWYQERRSSLGRFMPLAPILVAGVFFMLVMPYANIEKQPDSEVNAFTNAVSQINDPKETTIQESDRKTADDQADEEIEADMAAVSQGTEDLSDAQIDSTAKSEETNNPETDSAAEEQAGSLTQPIDSGSDTLTTFYRADGSPVKVDINKDYILYFASHCEVCNLALAKVNLMPEQERPILIDIWIPDNSNLDNEKQVVQEKFANYAIDPLTVVYDLDRVNPVPKVPRFVNK